MEEHMKHVKAILFISFLTLAACGGGGSNGSGDNLGAGGGSGSGDNLGAGGDSGVGNDHNVSLTIADIITAAEADIFNINTYRDLKLPDAVSSNSANGNRIEGTWIQAGQYELLEGSPSVVERSTVYTVEMFHVEQISPFTFTFTLSSCRQNNVFGTNFQSRLVTTNIGGYEYVEQKNTGTNVNPQWKIVTGNRVFQFDINLSSTTGSVGVVVEENIPGEGMSYRASNSFPMIKISNKLLDDIEINDSTLIFSKDDEVDQNVKVNCFEASVKVQNIDFLQLFSDDGPDNATKVLGDFYFASPNDDNFRLSESSDTLYIGEEPVGETSITQLIELDKPGEILTYDRNFSLINDEVFDNKVKVEVSADQRQSDGGNEDGSLKFAIDFSIENIQEKSITVAP